MKLSEYLDKTGVSIANFSRSCGISENTMYTYVKGTSQPSIDNALKIEKQTSGAVKVSDFVEGE